MNKVEQVEIIEIWMSVEQGGEAYDFTNGKGLKLVALLANGQPIRLEKDFMMERRFINSQELKQFTSSTGENK